jgi:hypothetical protein
MRHEPARLAATAGPGVALSVPILDGDRSALLGGAALGGGLGMAVSIRSFRSALTSTTEEVLGGEVIVLDGHFDLPDDLGGFATAEVGRLALELFDLLLDPGKIFLHRVGMNANGFGPRTIDAPSKRVVKVFRGGLLGTHVAMQIWAYRP